MEAGWEKVHGVGTRRRALCFGRKPLLRWMRFERDLLFSFECSLCFHRRNSMFMLLQSRTNNDTIEASVWQTNMRRGRWVLSERLRRTWRMAHPAHLSVDMYFVSPARPAVASFPELRGTRPRRATTAPPPTLAPSSKGCYLLPPVSHPSSRPSAPPSALFFPHRDRSSGVPVCTAVASRAEVPPSSPCPVGANPSAWGALGGGDDGGGQAASSPPLLIVVAPCIVGFDIAASHETRHVQS